MSFDMNKKLGSQQKSKYPPLPELTTIQGRISSIIVRPKKFKGQPAFVTDMDGNFILDAEGQKIPRYEFFMVIDLKGCDLIDGSARHQWLAVGTSCHAKSNLTKLLSNLRIDLEDPTGIAVVNALTGKDITFQLINKPNPADPETPWQNIVLDTVRSVNTPKVSPKEKKSILESEPVQWQD